MKTGQGSYPGLNRFVDMLRGMQEKDMDVLMATTGFKGCGKTTFNIQVNRRYSQRYLKVKFDNDRFTAWDNYDVFTKIHTLPEYSPLNCDEAVRFAMGEDWMTAESKELKKLFTQIRVKHMIVEFAIPDFWWLDRKYRESLITIWVHIVKRGYAIVFLPDLTPGVDDVWHRDQFRKLFKRTTFNFFSANIDKIIKLMRKHRCYYDEFKFPKLPERVYNDYLKIRNKKVFDKTELTTRKHLRQFRKYMVKIPFWNVYHRWKELANLVKENEEKITHSKLQKFLAYDPITKEELITPETVRAWIRDVEEQRPVEAEKPENRIQ